MIAIRLTTVIRRAVTLCLTITLTVGVASAGVIDLVVISHKNDVNKKITVYDPTTGMQVLSHVPEGDFEENTPTWIKEVPEEQRFFVACPSEEDHEHKVRHPANKDDHEHDHEFEGLVEVFDYSSYSTDAEIDYVAELRTGNRPFHMEISPDGRIVVANDESDTISFVEAANLDITTVTAGHHHTTLAFVGDESGFDTYAGRFESPGEVDVVDALTGDVRATVTLSLDFPHNGVYSPHTERVYFACAGGISVIGTTGGERDTEVGTLSWPAGGRTSLLAISEDGRTLFGNVYNGTGAGGGLMVAYDLVANSSTTVAAGNCPTFSYSEDGKWLVTGDHMLSGGENYLVEVIGADPGSPNFMTVVHQVDLGNANQVGFEGVSITPDSQTAYIALVQSDEILVLDLSDFSSRTFPVEASPWFIRALEPRVYSSNVENWYRY